MSTYTLALPTPLIDPASVETPPPVRARIKEMQKQMEQMYGAKRTLENQLASTLQSLQSAQSSHSALSLQLHKAQKERRVAESGWDKEKIEIEGLHSATFKLAQDKLSLSVARYGFKEARWGEEKRGLEVGIAKAAHDNVKLQSKVDDLRLRLEGKEDEYESLQTAYNQTRKSLQSLRSTHSKLLQTTSHQSPELTLLRARQEKSTTELDKLRTELKAEREAREKAEKEGKVWKEEKEEKERELRGWVREEKGKGNDTDKQLRHLQSEIRALKSDLESKTEEAAENANEMTRLRKEVRGAGRMKEELERLKADKEETEAVCEKLATKLRKLKAANVIAESTVTSPVAVAIKKPVSASVAKPSSSSAGLPIKAKDKVIAQGVEDEEMAEVDGSEDDVPKRSEKFEKGAGGKGGVLKRKVDAVSDGERSKAVTTKKPKPAAEETTRPRSRQRAASPIESAPGTDSSSESDGYVPPKKSAPIKSSRPTSDGPSKSAKAIKPLGNNTAQRGAASEKLDVVEKVSIKKVVATADDSDGEKGAAVVEAKPKKTMRKLGNPLNSLGGGANFLSLMLDNPNGTIPGVMSPAPAPGRLQVKPNVKRFNGATSGMGRF